MLQMGFSLYEACRRDFVIPDNCLNLGTTNAEVRRIRKLSVVDSFLSQFHYLHISDSFKSIAVITRAYGLYLGGMLAGVIVYNPPGSSSVSQSLFGTEYGAAELRCGTLALSRLAVHPDAPFNSTGYLISHSLKLLWEDNRERVSQNKVPFKTVVSFADTMFHSGTCYRAVSGWYAGRSAGGGLGGFYNPVTGKVISTRQGKVSLTAKNCPEGFVPFKATDKLKYLFFLGTRKDQLQTMRSLNESVKFQCKVDQFNVWKEGRMTKLSDTPSYEEVYQLFGKRGTEKAIRRYADYFMQKELKQ